MQYLGISLTDTRRRALNTAQGITMQALKLVVVELQTGMFPHNPICMPRTRSSSGCMWLLAHVASWNLPQSPASFSQTEQIPCLSTGPPYIYDYNVNTWDGSSQQSNTSTYYDAQKHAFMQPGTAGWFEWTYNGNSGAF